MPTTYNGIGTHYYGKKNPESRAGVCPHCGRQGLLESYDTRLWFVIVFIPVIPLGRKRIIDECPSCRRHFVMELDKWETAKQLEISGALEQYRADPSPEHAIAAHHQLIQFHQSTQAAEFRQMMREKFADNAKVQAYLGAALVHLGRLDEAAPCYERALALRPDLPEARVGVAQAHIRAQRFEEARKLLDFLEKPGAAQLYSLEPLETLALACQNAGRHAEALELFGKLHEALPAIADHAGFRANVQKSEKALNRKESLLPKRKFTWRRFFGRDRAAAGTTGPVVTWRGLAVAGAIGALILLGFIISNEYIRRHRTLHLVNAFNTPATVAVRGAATMRGVRGVTEMVLPEGRYHATLSGPVRQEIDFEVRASYLDRWFSDPAWVLNIGNGAVLVQETAVYSRSSLPVTYTFHFGEPFHRFGEVTHPFRPLPETLRMKESETRTLTRLDLYQGRMLDIFQHLEKQQQFSEALRFAETRLLIEGDDMEMLYYYISGARRQKQLERAEKFLQAGLTNRPIQIEFHRAYQGVRKDRQRDARLVAEYDALLQAEPENSALLYLRGRVSPTLAEGRRWFERALTADARNPYPSYALGYDQMARGDFAGARPLLARAVELRPTDRNFGHYLTLARCALGEHAALEQELRGQLKRDPANFAVVARLADVLAAQDKHAEAQAAITAFERSAGRLGDAAREIASVLRRRALYAAGDFAALEKQTTNDRTPGGRDALFKALIEQGRIADAVKINPQAESNIEQPFRDLIISVAWRHAGNENEAKAWYDRAVKAFEGGDDDQARVAALLRGTVEPAPAALDEVLVPLTSKAILLAALAQRTPNRRVELAAAARRFNVERDYPYHLIQRVTAEAR